MDHSQEHPSHTENHSSQKKRQSKAERIRNALAIVRDGKISFIDFLSQILDPSEKEFKAYCTAIYSVDDNSPPKLYQLFDLILNDPRGGPLFRCWIEAQAVDVVSSKVYDEMDDVKDALRGTISSITPEFLMTWDINSTMDRIIDKSAPTLHRLLESASQTDRARRENTKKTSTTVCLSLLRLLCSYCNGIILLVSRCVT
jgi:hypothetical protein